MAKNSQQHQEIVKCWKQINVKVLDIDVGAHKHIPEDVKSQCPLMIVFHLKNRGNVAGGAQSGARVLLLRPLNTRGAWAGPNRRGSQVVSLGTAQTPGIFKALQKVLI